jgi:phosphatidate cytidylyltransferase
MYRRPETPLPDAAATLFGVAYPAALCGSLVALRVAPGPWLAGGPPGAHLAFWLTTAVLFCVWGADTFAYFTGRAFGRHPLFPRVSPKKTWEGAVGGALGALLLAAGFKTFTPLDAVLTWPDVAAIAFACGIASPFGDLAESHFKRSVGVKDSATLLPGHGGMLDRIDAAVVAVPLVALYFDLVKG